MIQTTVNRASYTGDGVTTEFAFPATVLKTADVVVLLRTIATGVAAPLALGTHYEIDGVLDAAGRYANGITVRMLFAYPSTFQIIIYQDPALTQLVDLVDNGLLPVETQIELPLDRLTVIAQRLASLVLRTIRQPDSDTTDLAVLPDATSRASKFAAYDSAGNPIAAAGTSANLTPVSAFIDTLLDDADAPAARVTLGIPAMDGKGDILSGTGTVGVLAVTPSNGTSGLPLVTSPLVTSGIGYGFHDQFNGLVNGDMDVWQNGFTFSNVADGSYTADLWRWNQVGTGVVDVRRSTNVPALILNNHLYGYSIEVDVVTVDATIAVGDFYTLSTFLEGLDWRFFAQRACGLQFAVMSPKTGVHSVAITNTGTDRSYIATYTIDAANTWEYKFLSLGASPSAGTWAYDTGLGLKVQFALAAGGTFQNTAATWHTGDYKATSAQPNCLDNTANFFRLADVRLVPGQWQYPPRFEPFAVKLARCRRYYQKSRIYGEGITDASAGGKGEHREKSAVTGAVSSHMDVRFSVPMRVTPTVTTWNPNGSNSNVRNVTDSADCSGVSSAALSTESAQITFTANAGAIPGDQLSVHWAADARF